MKKPPFESSFPSTARNAWASELSTRERFWIEVFRLASFDTDPAPTLERVQEIRKVVSSWN
jgi:hypothetical protein